MKGKIKLYWWHYIGILFAVSLGAQGYFALMVILLFIFFVLMLLVDAKDVE